MNVTEILKNPETRKIFLAGCRTIMEARFSACNHCPTTDDEIIALLEAHRAKVLNDKRVTARLALQKYDIPQRVFRSMLFDVAGLNEDGFEVDKDGITIDSTSFRPLDPSRHRPWPHALYHHKTAGTEITPSEYEALDDAEKTQYTRIRYLEIKQYCNSEPCIIETIRIDDEAFIIEMIIQDIKADNPIPLRYLSEIGEGHGDIPRGLLADYRQYIIEALDDVSELSIHKALAKGYISGLEQLELALLQHKAQSAVGKHLHQITDTVPIDSSRFSDLDIINYRDVNGQGLNGAIQNESGEWKIIPADDERCNVEAQRTYLDSLILAQAVHKCNCKHNKK